jgi:tetratricopeptide (TPR) repeat protein
MRVLAWACLACSLVFTQLSLPQVAAAQGRGSSASSEDAEYRSVVEEALQEYNRGNWEEAAALFERAHRLNPSARTLRGMGLTAYEARRYVDAIRYLSDALTETRRPLTQAQREEVSSTLERARRFVAHLRLKVGPAEAKVSINGRPAEPDSRGDVTTDPGLLDVEITADGYESALRRVRLTAGGQEELTVQLSRTRPEAPPAAQVSSAVPDTTTAPAAATQKSPTDNSNPIGTIKWVVGGLAVAGLITGGVFVVLQKQKAQEYQDKCIKTAMRTLSDECETLKSQASGSLYTTSIIAFSVGGGLAAIATVLFVVDATDDDGVARNGCGVGGPGELGMHCKLTF